MKPKIFLEAHNIKNKFTGFGQFNYHLIKAIANEDIDDIQFVINSKITNDLKKEFGTKFMYHTYHSITRHWPFRIKKRFDLWHSLNQNIKVEPFYAIPYILTVHDVHFVTEDNQTKQEKEKQRFQQKLNRSHAITYISEFAKKNTHAHFAVPNVPEFVIYNGNTILDTSFKTISSEKKHVKRPFLFSIGAFTVRKNFSSLIDMLKFLPQYDLVLAGNDTNEYGSLLKQMVNSNQLKGRVHFIGRIDDAEKKYFFKNCEAFVFPSLREGFGIPPIEAMTFGKPVFLSNNTSLPEVGGEHSFYWDHYDPEYMANILKIGMKKYHDNPSFYNDWYVSQAHSFSWQKAARSYLTIYRNLLNL
jgi:glycosyltransferase involved in cell wall biosynthesis